MKLLFNILSAVSFLGMAGIVGGGAYVYVQRDAIIDSVKEAAMEEVTKALPGLLSGSLGGDLPGVGGDLPIPGGEDSEGGPSIMPVPGGLPF